MNNDRFKFRVWDKEKNACNHIFEAVSIDGFIGSPCKAVCKFCEYEPSLESNKHD